MQSLTPVSNQQINARRPTELGTRLLSDFSPQKIGSIITKHKIESVAENDLQKGVVKVDHLGISAAVYEGIIRPLKQILIDWEIKRSEFNASFGNHINELKTIERLQEEVNQASQDRDKEIQEFEQREEAKPIFVQLRDRFMIAERRFKEKMAENGNRRANMWAYSYTYWLLIVFIGVAEWQINYATLEEFFGVPSIAAGTTVVMAVCLSFAAHVHGTIFKQWAHLFADHRERRDKFSTLRSFSLATLALVVVLALAAASRYSVAIRSLSNNSPDNPFNFNSGVNPLRDVLFSLLANLAAWLVGVFIAYLGHDRDDEYMEATREYERARKKFNKISNDLAEKKRLVRSKYIKKIEEKKNAIATRTQGLEEFWDVWQRIKKFEHVLYAEVEKLFVNSITDYLDIMNRYRGQYKIYDEVGNEISFENFENKLRTVLKNSEQILRG